MWIVVYSKQAAKDSKKIEQSNLKETVKRLIEVLKNFAVLSTRTHPLSRSRAFRSKRHADGTSSAHK